MAEIEVRHLVCKKVAKTLRLLQLSITSNYSSIKLLYNLFLRRINLKKLESFNLSLITALNDLIRAALFPPNLYHYSAKERDAFNFVKSAVSHDPSVKQIIASLVSEPKFYGTDANQNQNRRLVALGWREPTGRNLICA